jgi:uncharacterized membrane protein
MHPLVVHFPIALLLTAPLLVLLAAVWRKNGFPLAVSALVVMALGTAGAFVAASTGEAAEGAASSPAAQAVLERHEELAEVVQWVFSGLTLLFAALVFVPRIVRRTMSGPVSAAANGVFLVLYLAGALLLANTAHQGGRLVHELGVRSPMSTSSTGELGGAIVVHVTNDGD